MLLLNGRAVDWNLPAIPITASVEHSLASSGDRYVVSIDAAFHLLDIALDNEVDVDVRLITEAKFSRSGWRFYSGSSQLYTTIAMPDGRVMNKPLNTA